MIIKDINNTTCMTTPDKAYEVFKALLLAEDAVDQDKEHLWVLHLNTRMQIKLVELVSLGTINESLISPREVYTRAIEARSIGVILCHNHPSGNLEPSVQDIEVTKKVKEAGSIIGIPLLDHLIITPEKFRSMRQSGDFT